jgi:hypothetical protein
MQLASNPLEKDMGKMGTSAFLCSKDKRSTFYHSMHLADLDRWEKEK